MTPIRTRIAPTPSGYLHKGNLYNFILTWLLSRQQNGQLLLRIDDMDGPRVRTEYLDDIFETLAFVELDYDEGPANTAYFLQHYSQQHRLKLYDDILQQLLDTGLVYGCTCSRKELSSKKCPCFYLKRKLWAPETAWKIKLPGQAMVQWKDEMLGDVQVNLSEAMGDFILRRKDGLPAYQLCSLADDLLYQTNYIVRGEDLLTSTAAQLWLAQILGKNDFPACRFRHHPLVKNEQEEKLSKSAGTNSIRAFRQSGGSPESLLQQIAPLPGINIKKPVSSLADMLQLFP